MVKCSKFTLLLMVTIVFSVISLMLCHNNLCINALVESECRNINLPYCSTEQQNILQLNKKSNVAIQLANLLPGETLERYFVVELDTMKVEELGLTIQFDEENVLAQILQMQIIVNENIILYSGSFIDIPSVLNLSAGIFDTDASSVGYDIAITMPTTAGNEFQNQQLQVSLYWGVSTQADDIAQDELVGSGKSAYVITTVFGASVIAFMFEWKRKKR